MVVCGVCWWYIHNNAVVKYRRVGSCTITALPRQRFVDTIVVVDAVRHTHAVFVPPCVAGVTPDSLLLEFSSFTTDLTRIFTPVNVRAWV